MEPMRLWQVEQLLLFRMPHRHDFLMTTRSSRPLSTSCPCCRSSSFCSPSSGRQWWVSARCHSVRGSERSCRSHLCWFLKVSVVSLYSDVAGVSVLGDCGEERSLPLKVSKSLSTSQHP
eukprot:1258796-Amphidinium_carterae.1